MTAREKTFSLVDILAITRVPESLNAIPASTQEMEKISSIVTFMCGQRIARKSEFFKAIIVCRGSLLQQLPKLAENRLTMLQELLSAVDGTNIEEVRRAWVRSQISRYGSKIKIQQLPFIPPQDPKDLLMEEEEEWPLF